MYRSVACGRSSGQASCSYSTDLPFGRRLFAGIFSRQCIPKRSDKKQHDLLREASARRELKLSELSFTTTATILLGSALLLLGDSQLALAESLQDIHSPKYHPVAAEIQSLASNEDFWSNLARYGRYFITVLLGTAYTAVKPIGGLLRRPVTAVFVVAFLVGLYLFLNVTLKGMLGVGQEPLNLIDY